MGVVNTPGSTSITQANRRPYNNSSSNRWEVSPRRKEPTREVITNINNNKQIKIIAINVNSVISNEKRNYLLEFTNLHKPDIILLSETKLNNRHRLEFENYSMIRTNRPHSKQGGGTAILIRREISYKHIKLLDNKLDTIESTIISLKLKNNRKLYIASIYASNNTHTKKIKEDIELIFKELKLHKEENLYILAGDWNARSLGDFTEN